ncbi:hypothetical protein SDC9_176160 [bioreactor metagenome]|uniref:Uncharacterized protein n=1 Tax=bioreactor metagenome TaxID=1076179 RepID=A0A645GPW7_9ZZZZ
MHDVVIHAVGRACVCFQGAFQPVFAEIQVGIVDVIECRFDGWSGVSWVQSFEFSVPGC